MQPTNGDDQREPRKLQDAAFNTPDSNTVVPGKDAASAGNAEANTFALSAGDKALLLHLARETMRHATGAGPLPQVDESSFSPSLLTPHGCFVTLFYHGELRGCIGHIFPREPLYRAIIESAYGAAMRDPRFPAVTESEVDQLLVEISVLTDPAPIPPGEPEQRLSRIEPGRHGVVLRLGGRSWTFLPQVWRHFPSPEEFMARLCAKAGAEPQAWRDPRVELLTYEVNSFEDGPEDSADG